MAYLVPVPTAFNVVPGFQTYPGVSGYNLSVLNNTQLQIAPGMARSLVSDFIMQYPSFSINLPANITLDISVVGPNGCFPSLPSSLGLTNDTMFGIYICEGSSGTTDGSTNPNVGPVAIMATGNNFLPNGYDQYRRIGLAYYNHTSGHIIPMLQSGNDMEREYLLQDPIAAVSGSATSATEVDLTSGAGVIMPNANVMVNFNVALTAFAAGSYVCMQPNALTASTASAAPTKIEGNVASVTTATNVWMLASADPSSGDASIKYLVDNAGSTAVIEVAGFRDSLSLKLF